MENPGRSAQEPRGISGNWPCLLLFPLSFSSGDIVHTSHRARSFGHQPSTARVMGHAGGESSTHGCHSPRTAAMTRQTAQQTEYAFQQTRRRSMRTAKPAKDRCTGSAVRMHMEQYMCSRYTTTCAGTGMAPAGVAACCYSHASPRVLRTPLTQHTHTPSHAIRPPLMPSCGLTTATPITSSSVFVY